MKDYLVTLLVVSAATAVLSLLPSDEKMKKTVSFALSLGVLSALILPLPALLERLPSDYSSLLSELDGSMQEGDGYLKEVTLSAVGEGIAAHLSERYGIKGESISVTAEGDIVDETVILRHVTVYLTGHAAAADVPALVRYVEAETGADCEVVYLEE